MVKGDNKAIPWVIHSEGCMRHREHCLMKMQMQRHKVTLYSAEDSHLSFPLLDSALTRLDDLWRRDGRRRRSSWVRLLSLVYRCRIRGRKHRCLVGLVMIIEFGCTIVISPFELVAVRKDPLDIPVKVIML